MTQKQQLKFENINQAINHATNKKQAVQYNDTEIDLQTANAYKTVRKSLCDENQRLLDAKAEENTALTMQKVWLIVGEAQ